MNIIDREIWTPDIVEDKHIPQYPESFNYDEFVKLNSFSKRIKYADARLKKIASGSGRAVYEIDDKTVLKLAKNPKGIAQNEFEHEVSNHAWFDDIITKVVEHDLDYYWIESERAKKITSGRFKQITGIKIEDLNIFLHNYYNLNQGKRKFYNQEEEIEEFLWNNEFSYRITQLMSDYDVPSGDFGKISSYGEVIRDGKPTVVIIDYGVNMTIFNQYYSEKPRRGVYEEIDFNDVKDGGYAGWALLPDSVNEDELLLDEYKIETNIGWFDVDERLAPTKRDLFVTHLEILPQYRGQGKFKELLADIEEYAIQKNKNSIVLEPDITKGKEYADKLILLYKKYGFLPYEDDPSLLYKDLSNKIKENNLSLPIGKSFSFIRETNNEDYRNISDTFLKKSVDFIEGLVDKNQITQNISKYYRHYLINKQNIDRSIELANNINQFYNNLMIVQDFFTTLGLVQEDLAYWHVNDASPESDQYELFSEGVYGFLEDTAWEILDDVKNRLKINVRPQPLGSGAFGYAFGIGNNLVLKITTDQSEAIEGLKIKKINSDRVANIKNVFEYKYKNKTYYIIILEKLDTSKQSKYFRLINNIEKILENELDKLNEDFSDVIYYEYLTDRNYFNKHIKPIIDEVLVNHPEEFAFYNEILEIADVMIDNNILSADFLKVENLGEKDGKLATFDVGLGDTNWDKDMPEKLGESINEDGLIKRNKDISKILNYIENNVFAIITAYKNDNEAEENQIKNNKLLKDLLNKNPNIIRLTGHWQENGKETVKEESFFIPIPEDLDKDIFINWIKGLGQKYKQEAVLIGEPQKGIILYYMNGEEINKGKPDLITINKTYSELRNKPNLNFVFEERIISWMPKMKTVSVKKKCMLGGKGDGTSDACNQGDISNLELKDLKDGQSHKPNTVNVAEDEKWFEKKSNVLKEEKIRYGCLMGFFDFPNWNNVLNKILDEDVYDDGSGTFGKETEPHLTVLYGFHDEVSSEDFNEIVKTINKPIGGKAIGITIFENKEFDVVKISIEPNEELLKLRKQVENLPNTLTYSEYNPHITISYVKKGMGKKYVYEFKKPIELLTTKLVFSNKNKNKTTINIDNIKVNENDLYDPETGQYYIGDGKELIKKLEPLKTEFAKAAQKVYDAWEQNEEGYDETYGSGGICDDIAEAMCNVASRNGIHCFTQYDEYECHTSFYAYDEQQRVLVNVDIRPYVYETGGGYTWKKIKEVVFDADHITITDMSGYYENYVNIEENKKNISENISINLPSKLEGYGSFKIMNGEEVVGEVGISDRGIQGKNHYIVIDKIFIDKNFRGNNYANDAMKIIFDYADKNNIIITLTPDNTWGANVSKLKAWYKSLGFVENKNKKKDFQTMQLMYRLPKNMKLNEKLNVSEAEMTNINQLEFVDRIERMGGIIYSVGGAVRDEFLGKESKDLDILITGIPFDVLSKTLNNFGKVSEVGKSFGIIKFTPNESKEEIDIAIPRSEKPTGEGGYKGFDVKSDHNLPIEDDLLRRDFTINAIAKDIHGNIIDPFNGIEDIKNKVIRVVNPEAFSDDPLRMLRAVQFSSRFGFTIEPKTMKMIQNNASRIKEIPGERILIELDKIVKKGNPLFGAKMLKETGLMKEIWGSDNIYDGNEWNSVKSMSEFIWLLSINNVSSPSEFYKTKLKGDIDVSKEILAIDKAMKEASNDKTKNRALVFNMYSISPTSINSQILPQELMVAANELKTNKYPLTLKQLTVNGNDLMSLGYKGEEIGKTLKNVLIKIYADKLKNDRNEILNALKAGTIKEGAAIGDMVYFNDGQINFVKQRWDMLNQKYRNNPFYGKLYNRVLIGGMLTKNQWEDFKFLLQNGRTRYESGIIPKNY